jgi:hypothetical protein
LSILGELQDWRITGQEQNNYLLYQPHKIKNYRTKIKGQAQSDEN